MKKKYDNPEKFYVDWQTPPSKGKTFHSICYLVFPKSKHDKIINISRKKALATHDLNVSAKAFFYGKQKFIHLEERGVSKWTCPKLVERTRNAECGFKKIKICFDKQEFALSRDRETGVYIYGARLKTA